mmetsp:Transcript_79024/g.226533  ORF Transcript_79024/g.226533 Transcript_79024/m.226533 type:complete len:245 (-) Transcript_79024:399-1133(-)
MRKQMKTQTMRSVRRPAPSATRFPVVGQSRFHLDHIIDFFDAPACRSQLASVPMCSLEHHGRECPSQLGGPLPWQLPSSAEPRSSHPHLGTWPWLGQPEFPSTTVTPERFVELECAQMSRSSLPPSKSSKVYRRLSDNSTRSLCCRRSECRWVRGGLSRQLRCLGRPLVYFWEHRRACHTQSFVPCTTAPRLLIMSPSSRGGCSLPANAAASRSPTALLMVTGSIQPRLIVRRLREAIQTKLAC